MKAHLTIRNVPSLPAIDGEPTEYRDEVLTGFYLRVSPPSTRYPKGVRAFGVYRRVGGRRGRQRRFPIGRHPLISLAEARDRAREILKAGSLRGDRGPRSGATTNLVELVTLFIAASRKQVPRVRGDGTLKEYARLVKSYLAGTPEGEMPIDALTRRELRAMLRPRAAEAPVQTQRVRQMLQAAFGWALDEDPPIVEKDPTRGLENFADDTSRERTLRDEEIVTLWRACLDHAAAEYTMPSPGSGRRVKKEAEKAAALQRSVLARWILLTGARPGEAALMDLPELELKSRLWHVPAEHRKGQRGKRKPHIFPLSTPAVEVIGELGGAGGRGRAFPFTAKTGKYDPHWVEPLYARAKQLGLTDHWTPHDLRRTCSTILSRLGYSRGTIALVLGHTLMEGGAVTGVYDRFDRLPERIAALNAVGAHVAQLVGQQLLSGQLAENA